MHPADVLFASSGGASDREVQIQARTVYEGEEDRAPDDEWLGALFNP